MMQPNETASETDSLTGPQRRALTALLEGATVPEAAKRAGVARGTVWRWLQEPQFSAALRLAESQQLGEVARALGAAGASAVATLVTIKDDVTVPAAVRARAAKDLLGTLLPVRETAMLEARIAALESALDGKS